MFMGPSDPSIHAAHGVLASGARTQPCFLQALLPLMPTWPRLMADLRTPYNMAVTWPESQCSGGSEFCRGGGGLSSLDRDTCVVVKVVFRVWSAPGGHGALKTFTDLHLTDASSPRSAGPRARQTWRRFLTPWSLHAPPQALGGVWVCPWRQCLSLSYNIRSTRGRGSPGLHRGPDVFRFLGSKRHLSFSIRPSPGATELF